MLTATTGGANTFWLFPGQVRFWCDVGMRHRTGISRQTMFLSRLVWGAYFSGLHVLASTSLTRDVVTFSHCCLQALQHGQGWHQLSEVLVRRAQLVRQALALEPQHWHQILMRLALAQQDWQQLSMRLTLALAQQDWQQLSMRLTLALAQQGGRQLLMRLALAQQHT
jgi:hypothetical protein